MRMAVIENGRVTNVIEAADGFEHPQGHALVPSKTANIGDTYDGKTFAPGEPLPGPVPTTISARQFKQQLAHDGKITEAEALVWVGRGDIPVSVAALVDELPEEQRFGARMLLVGAGEISRDHWLVPVFGKAMGYTSAMLDDFWRSAAALG
jgi:hypothetical protein